MLDFHLPAKSRGGQLVEPASWWLIMLVFIPLLLLAGFGIKGLQTSRLAARQGAEREIGRAVLSASDAFAAALIEERTFPGPQLYELPPVPASPGFALELYRQALTVDSDQALALLTQAAEAEPAGRTESGVPLLPLIEWRRLQLRADLAAMKVQAANLARSAVETHPSVLTPELLERAGLLLHAQGLDANVLGDWRERWAADERVRSALRSNASLLASSTAPAWILSGDESWWAEPAADPGGWRLLARPRLKALATIACERAAQLLPEYASLQIHLTGVPLMSEQSGEVLARTTSDDFRVAGILHDPASLYAQQRVQTFWLAALLGCALVAACGGTWMMSTSLARERQLNALKSDFVSSISHELRAPVASMRIMAENLGSGIVSDEVRRREYHQLIADECWRLGTLIENVLDLARIERNRKVYHFAEADVAALACDAVQLLQPRAAQRRQEIVLESEPIEPPPVCDSLAVQQALINLIDNAIKFSPEQTLISVRLAGQVPAHWILEVIDQGPGIPEGEQAKIFERFYRIGSELRRETRGTGIGLSIVAHIVAGHGGTITVQNQPACGTKFTLRLPCEPPRLHTEPILPCRAS